MRILGNPIRVYGMVMFCMLFFQLAAAQINGIKLYHAESNEEVFLEENKRIRVKTIDGQRISGRFKLVDDEHFVLKSNYFSLSDIETIKRHPIVVSSLIDGILFNAGMGLMTLPIIIFPFTGETGIVYYLFSGVLVTYAGAKSPNPLRGFKKSKGWQYTIIFNDKTEKNSDD